MKKINDVYSKLQTAKETLKSKEYEYSQLNQIAAMDSNGSLLYNKIQVLKGYVKALEWVLN